MTLIMRFNKVITNYMYTVLNHGVSRQEKQITATVLAAHETWSIYYVNMNRTNL